MSPVTMAALVAGIALGLRAWASRPKPIPVPIRDDAEQPISQPHDPN